MNSDNLCEGIKALRLDPRSRWQVLKFAREVAVATASGNSAHSKRVLFDLDSGGEIGGLDKVLVGICALELNELDRERVWLFARDVARVDLAA